ncbi:MAG: caspase family protein [Cytophagales bacterium]|nr:caspase family protein [Cytophagales bacterium]
MKKLLLIVLGWACITASPAQMVLKQKLKLKLIDQEVVRTLTFSTNSRRLVAGGDKGTLAVYDIANGDSWNLPSHPGKVMALAFSYDNRYVASASEDGTFSLYDFQDSKIQKLNGETGLVRAIAFSPTGRVFATGVEGGKISIWDLTTREKISTFSGKEEKVLALDFSPDGKWLASGSADNTVLLWIVETGTLAQRFTGHQDWVRTLAFSADGKILASGSYDKSIKFWDLETGSNKSTFKANKGWVTDIHYSGDGQYIISGGARGEVILLDPFGKVIQRLGGFSALVTANPFSLDGKWVAVADLSTSVSLYDVTALNIQPWKPFDVTPPSIVVLSPKLLSSRDVATGFRKSVVHQPTVRVMLEISDLSGVKQVMLNGIPLKADPTVPNRYLADLSVTMNSEKTLLVNAMDNAGNSVEEKILIEHKRFSGSVDAKKYHAMLIAIQDYKDPSITDLDQPVKDMNKLKSLLVNEYAFLNENIMVLENPDRNTLYAKFDEMQSKLDKIDNLMIFYAGHGYWDTQLEQGYWLPSDAEPNKRSSWLSNGTLRDYIAGIGARHTLLITDACFSGGIFKSRAVFENASAAIETLYLRKSRKAMTSGTLEKVPDKSVFLEALLNRLHENQEPYVTAEELFSGIRHDVINRSPNNQVPQYGEIGQTGDEGGEFIFIRKN